MGQSVGISSVVPVAHGHTAPAPIAECVNPTSIVSAPRALRLASEDARDALALVLELGSQALDGSELAVKHVPSALSVAASRVCAVHEALRSVALAAPRRFAQVLSEHAARRATGDCQELARLMQSLQRAEQPALVGRCVVVAALTLLSNLAADERWCASLERERREPRPPPLSGAARLSGAAQLTLPEP